MKKLSIILLITLSLGFVGCGNAKKISVDGDLNILEVSEKVNGVKLSSALEMFADENTKLSTTVSNIIDDAPHTLQMTMHSDTPISTYTIHQKTFDLMQVIHEYEWVEEVMVSAFYNDELDISLTYNKATLAAIDFDTITLEEFQNLSIITFD